MSRFTSVSLKTDCLHARGDIPCKPHKLHGVRCDDCSYYQQRSGRILIIKLGATGDVIRTSVLLKPLRERYPNHEIWWLTQTPEVVPSSVEKRLHYTADNVLTVQHVPFDVAINLDKDLHACALMSSINAKEHFGFTLVDGLPGPVNELAQHKFITGVFDDVNKANTVSYPQEIIELCGLTYQRQEYVMDAPSPSPLTIPEGRGSVVGLNTGCGDRWIAREWPIESWISLIEMLKGAGHRVLLLGGPAEHERNVMLKERTGALYEGTFPLAVFPSIVNTCDVVVTAVTMALHVAIALKKRVVLMNNIFNKHEFELYGRGVLIEPEKTCTCFFQHDCTNPEYRCMNYLRPETIFNAVVQHENVQE